ncbi:MAG: putative threonine synthase [Anaerolineales bacterium]|nr:putative threonine synthase [Anaerolineales bacterium]MBM2844023.1 putative threonine synthase [Anaerolineales bacterium]
MAPTESAPTFEVECLDCGRRGSYHPLRPACPACGSLWLEARYDLEAARLALLSMAATARRDLWRYAPLLPLSEVPPGVPMGEGWSPLLQADNLGLLLGLPHLFIKDERRGPTASFKDRQAAVTTAVLRLAGVREAVVASTGNVALAYSAYCARLGIQLWAFLTSRVPAAKMHEVALYGTQVVKVTSTYDQAKELASEFAARHGYYFDRATSSVASVESMKTIAFEIAQQLGDPSEGSWRAPDWYVQAVSGGLGPYGVLKGFRELHAMGLIDHLPRIAVIQAAGCDPMVRAWKADADVAEPLLPTTRIYTLSTGNPGRGYTLLRRRILEAAGGAFESVSDDEAIQAMHQLAKMEGLSAEPAAGVAFAGLIRLAHQGVIEPDETVVVNLSGHSMPVEEEALGEGWYRDLTSEAAPADVPEDGLLAALAQLDQRVTREVLIVDDHPEARRLLRRILNAHGEYEISEAASGREALAVVERRQPDLMILDLMMPGMDGFAVLDALRQQPSTAAMPVVVVTAKELTPAEERRLQGRIRRLMTKGEFLGEDLLGEIDRALE